MDQNNENARFLKLVDFAASVINSKNTRRVYQQTWRSWLDWCKENADSSPMEITPERVVAFLTGKDISPSARLKGRAKEVVNSLSNQKDVSPSTQRRHIAAFRKLVEVACIQNQDEATYQLHKNLMHVKPSQPVTTLQLSSKPHQKTLSPAEITLLLNCWSGTSPQHKRNHALIAVLFASGIRPSEVASLRWNNDVNLDSGYIRIFDGKNDDFRSVPLVGEFAVEALREWHEAQGDGNYKFVFCAIERGGMCSKKDSPITATDVYRIWTATAKKVNIKSKPTDARKALITNVVASGGSAQAVQSITGNTLLKYTKPLSGREARKKLRVPYGGTF